MMVGQHLILHIAASEDGQVSLSTKSLNKRPVVSYLFGLALHNMHIWAGIEL